MNDRPIAVFDSGVGGLPYLEQLKKYAPAEDFVYFADRGNFPYGEQEDAVLRNLIVQSVGKFIDATDPKLMLIACNTASVVALEELRRQFTIPFIGVVPAVKPAAKLSKQRAIGVLATRRTVEDPYTEDLIRRFAADCKVVRYAGVEIVQLVELNYFSSTDEERAAVLQPAVDFFSSQAVDALVVGCTHFIFVEELLHKMLMGSVEIIDSREGVAQQALRIMKEKHLFRDNKMVINTSSNANNRIDSSRLFVSGNDLSFRENERYHRFSNMFELEWSGRL
ncbi:MAG TPA: glutamate racemase [Clostridia bacterium]|nr:glutamate racemase [Clostridia bacterium]